jgi:hypothetical protein
MLVLLAAAKLKTYSYSPPLILSPRKSPIYLMRSLLPGCSVRKPGFSFFKVLTRTP